MGFWSIAIMAYLIGTIITALILLITENYFDYSSGYNRGYSKGLLDGYDLYQKFHKEESDDD